MFYDILEPKKTFLRYKNKKFKKSKNVYGPKMFLLQPFCLGNIGQENLFYDILDRKNAFLRYKNKKLEKSKN